MQHENTERGEPLTDSLAEGIAAVMAANAELDEIDDMTDLFLGELNRLWCEPDLPEAA